MPENRKVRKIVRIEIIKKHLKEKKDFELNLLILWGSLI